MLKIFYRIILRKDKARANGLCPIYLQLIIDRKILKKALNELCDPDYWDAVNGKIKKDIVYPKNWTGS